MENSNSEIKKSVSKTPVTIDKVYVGNFQKNDELVAQLRQEIKTVASYPTAQISNEAQDNIFSLEDFGIETKPFESSEKRVAWLDVPKGSTVDAVTQKMAAFPNACIYKVMDNRPILLKSQLYAIENGDRTMDDFANSQVVRYPESHENAGEIIKDTNGKVQYRATYFSSDVKEDIDNRNESAEYQYLSAEIKAELMGATVLEGQGI